MKRLIVSVSTVALLASPVSAQAFGGFGQSWTPKEAYDARKDGDIKPLKDIINQLERDEGGKYINARLSGRDSAQPVYIVDWELDGRIVVFTVDAKTGRILNRQGG